MFPQLSDRDGLMIARSYELISQDVAADALVVETWQQPADELVVWLSRRHGWRADLSVSYLTTLRSLFAPPPPLEQMPMTPVGTSSKSTGDT